jgi:hypothetical protein
MKTQSYVEKIVILKPEMAETLETMAKIFRKSVNEVAHVVLVEGLKHHLKVFLEIEGYDGFFNREKGCACEKTDLCGEILCGEIEAGCEPGYKSECNCGEHDFHIG